MAGPEVGRKLAAWTTARGDGPLFLNGSWQPLTTAANSYPTGWKRHWHFANRMAPQKYAEAKKRPHLLLVVVDCRRTT